jgi:hypothetical protein
MESAKKKKVFISSRMKELSEERAAVLFVLEIF